jgi:hypothetical protein
MQKLLYFNFFFFYPQQKIRNSTKSYETKCFDLQTEKNNIERQLMAEEAKSREVFQKINDIQVRYDFLLLLLSLSTNLTFFFVEIPFLNRTNWSC